MAFAQVLAFLLALLNQAPAIFKWLQDGIDLLPQPTTLAVVELTTEEQALEGQLLTKLSTGNSVFDGSRVRKLMAFLKEHPELVKMFAGMLGIAL